MIGLRISARFVSLKHRTIRESRDKRGTYFTDFDILVHEGPRNLMWTAVSPKKLVHGQTLYKGHVGQQSFSACNRCTVDLLIVFAQRDVLLLYVDVCKT